jgi:hypothetical protein
LPVRQLDSVEVDRTFTDTASGKDTARPRLDELIAFVLRQQPWTELAI